MFKAHKLSATSRGRIIGILVVALVALTAGGYAAASALTVPGNTTDGLAETSSNTNLSPTGGQTVTLTSIALPAGSWVVSSEATLVNFGPSDYTRCQIVAGGHQIASGTTMVGDPSLTGGQGPAAYVAARGLLGSVKSSTAFTASLLCSHDHTTPAGNGPGYVDGGAVLWAHKAAVLSGTTH